MLGKSISLGNIFVSVELRGLLFIINGMKNFYSKAK